MATEAPIYRERTAQYSPLQGGASFGASRTAETAGSELTRMGADIEKQARKSALLDYSIGLKQAVTDIEERYHGDPDAMSQAFDSFQEGYLADVEDEELGMILQEQFLTETRAPVRRAVAIKRQRLDNEVRSKAAVAAEQSERNIKNALPYLFADDEETALEAQKSIQVQAITLRETADLQDSDGNYVFSPQGRAGIISTLQGLEDFLARGEQPAGEPPLAVRNNNPGNLRGSDGNFRKFDTPEEGKKAMEADLRAKIGGSSSAMKARYGEDYTPTLESVISVYAPDSENDTAAYIETVSNATGIPAGQKLTAKDIPAVMSAMIRVEGGSHSANYFAASAIPAPIRQAFEAKLDSDMAQDPGAFLQKLEGGGFDQFITSDMKAKYAKEARTLFEDQQDRARFQRIVGETAASQNIYAKFLANSPNILQEIEDYRNNGGNEELANYMRKQHLSANPISDVEQSNVYSSLYDKVMQLGIRTKDGEIVIEKGDASLEDLIRLQDEIMKESVRGVKELTPLLRKLAPAVLQKAKNERGKDDLGEFNSVFFLGSLNTEAYDPGYEQIQGWLEGQGKDTDTAMKAEMLREFVTKADKIPEDVVNDPALFQATQQELARRVIARQAVKGMKSIPVSAVEHLMREPNTAGQFDELFGKGMAARLLGSS